MGRLGYVSVTHVLKEKSNYKCLCLTAPMLMLLIAFLGENLFVSHGHDTISVGRSVGRWLCFVIWQRDKDAHMMLLYVSVVEWVGHHASSRLRYLIRKSWSSKGRRMPLIRGGWLVISSSCHGSIRPLRRRLAHVASH